MGKYTASIKIRDKVKDEVIQENTEFEMKDERAQELERNIQKQKGYKDFKLTQLEPDQEEVTEDEKTNYDSMKVEDLKAFLDEQGIEYDTSAKKPQLIELAKGE